MKKLSRSAWIAIAAVIAVPATVAIAKGYHHGGWHNMSPETRMRLEEGKIAGAKAALKLSAEQEKLWEPVEAQVRTFFKDRQERFAERQKMREERKKQKAEGKDVAKPDMAERVEKMSQHMAERAERMKAFSEAFKPFYASLSDEQKDVLRPLARKLLPGMGGHHGRKGHRWAMDGDWGGRGGHHGHHGWGGRHGGPMMDGGPKSDGPADTAPSQADDAEPSSTE